MTNLKTAADLAPGNDEAVVNLGVAYLYMGDDYDAKETFNKVSKGFDLVMDDKLLGAFVDLGRWNDVIDILKTRVQKNPNEVNNYISLASAYLKIGDSANAISALNIVSSLRPDYKATADAYIQEIKAGKNPGR